MEENPLESLLVRCPLCRWATSLYSPNHHHWTNPPDGIPPGTHICTNKACANFPGKFTSAESFPELGERAPINPAILPLINAIFPTRRESP